MTVQTGTSTRNDYLDMQARVGITKHLGGFAATDGLLARCHVNTAREVLYIGSGIGVGPAYIARQYGCHVVAIDISAQMIAWSRLQAQEEAVTAQIDLAVADALALPFVADRFDAVICESVLGFVDDKQRAIAACVRVTRPGGYVGLNETLWVTAPPPGVAAQMRTFNVNILPAEDWRRLWATSRLQDRVMTVHELDTRTEVTRRIAWVGWRWALRAWGRLVRLYITSPASRQAMAQQFGSAMDSLPCMGYGLFTGQKPCEAGQDV